MTGPERTLREEIADVLVALPPTAIYSDGTIKIVAEPIADALLPVVQARIDAAVARAEAAEQALARVRELVDSLTTGPQTTRLASADDIRRALDAATESPRP